MKSRTPLFSSIALIGLALALGTRPASAFVTVSVTPTNQAVLVGSNPSFTAQVSTTAGEVITGYTWLTSTNGLSPFTAVAGATTATCTLPNVQVSNAGYYFVQVAYTLGGISQAPVASSAVTLTVYDQARILTQPVGGQIRIVGSNVTFSATVAGSTPLTYQWRFNGANLGNNARISGANSTNLAISALVTTDSGSYDLVVSNIYSSATSQVATLSVLIPPGISTQPQSTVVIASSNATLNVTPTGSSPIGYTWSKNGSILSNGGRISGATSTTLTIATTATNDTGSYSVVLSNAVGSITSSVATVTVLVPPTITSATNFAWRQGAFLNFTVTATGSTPITFGSSALPQGLILDPLTGILSGVPQTIGVFNIALYATNAAMTTTGALALTLTTGSPGITSSLSVSGRQGQNFTYSILASNVPTLYNATPLPAGLNLNLATGVISGAPIVSGVFQASITAANQFGSDTEVLVLDIASSLPVITSALTSTWTENQTNYSYTIRASNSPTSYGASNLPLGLFVNPTNGVISGTPYEGGTFRIPIWANNAWGTGTNTLVLTLSYATISGLAISNVVPSYSQPYVLDFAFSLLDPTTGVPVVLPLNQFQVTCMEDGFPIASEAPLVLSSAAGSKQLKTFLVLDYTYSMYVVPGAIDAMEAASVLLISQEPLHAMFGVVEFNADYMTPNFVTNSMTAPPNYFITDKTILAQSIGGIRTNYVQGNYAGTRCWDAMYMALNNFGPATNPDEQRYLVAMTDGNDSSSLLNTNSDPTVAVTTLYKLAQANHVAIYCVGFGNNVNTNSLQLLTSKTGGKYYLAATTADLGAQFQSIQQQINGQYVLRWATLKRSDIPAYPADGFQPSFEISISNGGNVFTTTWNTDIVTTNLDIVGTNSQGDVVTNTITTNVVQFPFNPPTYSNDVRVGALRLVQDAEVGPQTIRLRTTYSPRSVRELRLQYQANYPCTPTLDSTGSGGILAGWTMTQTTDTNGLSTLMLLSSDTNNLLTSIPYAAFGDLVEFDFTYPDALTATQAFRIFTVDNSIYTNMLPSGQSFTLSNAPSFTANYTNPPPHGTPIPWLISYGFTTNFAQAELIATNGLPVWQDYIAGLNPTNPASQFKLWTAFTPGQTPQVMFSTVLGRTYRLDTATSLTSWSVLRDNMPGTGHNILFIDNRPLSGVQGVYYRISVH